jgi:hypothetical protein
MNKNELDLRLKTIQNECDQQKIAAIKEFCDANNPYKPGDTFTDHIGTIIIEKITYGNTFGYDSYPCCIYDGTVITKKGVKTTKKRTAWQCNEVPKK